MTKDTGHGNSGSNEEKARGFPSVPGGLNLLHQTVEWHIKKQAKDINHEALTILTSVSGIGLILSLVIFYEIHDINRSPMVNDFASHCRLIKCKKESAGKSYGASGSKIGNAHLKWAFGEAAVFHLRDNPVVQKWLEKTANKHNKARVHYAGPQVGAGGVHHAEEENTVC